MRIVAAGIGAVIGVCVTSGQAEAFSVSYDQKVTQGTQVVNSKVIMKDEMFRVEAMVEGQETVTLRTPKGTYTYLPKEGMAMKVPELSPSQRPVEHADDYQQYLKERQAQRIGAETVDGHPCDIYRFTEPSAGGTVTAWVWTEKQFPVKMEIDAPGGKVLVELTNIQLVIPIADNVFELPAGVQIMDIGALMGGR